MAAEKKEEGVKKLSGSGDSGHYLIGRLDSRHGTGDGPNQGMKKSDRGKKRGREAF